MVTYPFLSTGLFLTQRRMERVRMTSCHRCSRRLGRLVSNLMVYFGIDGILAWITSSCCASGAGHFSSVRDVGFPPTALPTQLKGFGWVISDRVEAGEEEVRFFISMKHKYSRSVKMPRISRVTIGDSNRSATLSAVRPARPANSLTTSCWHYEPL